MYPDIKAALLGSDISANIVMEIRDGPTSVGSVGVLSLFHVQGTSITANSVGH